MGILTTELGIAGLCVTGLLGLIVFLSKSVLKEFKLMREQHSTERREWRIASQMESELTRKVLRDIDSTIKHLLKDKDKEDRDA
jgi:heme exporter protein D